ncbi:LCP family protein [Cytobacillus sp.]|uniref:LCP family protein n=1 Tax=Cytobacillus sp. TaxID=2675269 RepID=UPI0035170CFF
MSHDRRSHNKQKKRIRRKRLVTFILLPILFLTLSATAYGAFLYNKAQTVMSESYTPVERETSREKVDPKEENTSVLFIGVDDSNVRNFDSGSRSDALMLATFNEKRKSVKLLSIPRDSYVYIPELGYEDKITHAHANGGVVSTIDTVEGLLDIPIDYYVKMNFNAFIDVIDALDGIEVEVPYAISEMDSKDRRNAINLEPGYQELDGEEALAFARTRKQDNDIERGKRQQEIIKAIMDKSASAKGLTKYADVIEAVGDNMTTDLSFSEMKSFIDYAVEGTGLNVETLSLAGSDAYIDSIYYYQLDEDDLENVKETLSSHLELTEAMNTADNHEYQDEQNNYQE